MLNVFDLSDAACDERFKFQHEVDMTRVSLDRFLPLVTVLN